MADVKENPEHIWAYSWTGKEGYQGQWDYIDTSQIYGNVTEYVRADMHDALVKERNEAEGELLHYRTEWLAQLKRANQAEAEVERVKGLLKNLSEISILHLKWRDQALARAEKAEIDAEFFQSEMKLRNRIESTNDTAADLQRKYEEALARAAAASMEMRERAATHTQWTAWGERHVLTEAARKAIRALPIDPDAQKALDQLLAKAREDGIREAAEQCEKERWNTSLLMSNPPQSDAARMIGLHILALLNKGDQP